MSAQLIDTNVMLASSAIFELSNLSKDAMPRERLLREMIYNWLVAFEESNQALVLDDENLIRMEYERNMKYNQQTYGPEYGMLVVQNKIDTGQVSWVTITAQEGNGEIIAVLNEELTKIVTDREDRKWVASSLSHRELYEFAPPIVYGAESDWFLIEDRLAEHGVVFKRLLPDSWYQSRHSS